MNEELNKKLLEFAGFEVFEYMDGYRVGWYGQGKYLSRKGFDLTKSLDACFKWLVPKALTIIAMRSYAPPIMKLFQLWYDELVALTGDSSNTKQSALALCLAIEKLMDKE